MTNDKIKIKKSFADYIRNKINEKHGNIDNFVKWEGFDKKELSIGLKEKKLSAHFLCCIYEKLQLQNYEEGRIIDSKIQLKKLVKEANGCDSVFEDKLGMDYLSVIREINGERVSKTLFEKLNKEIEIPKDINNKSSLGIKYAATSSNIKEANENIIIVLNDIIDKLSIEHLKIFSENIEAYSFMMKCDWEFLYLIQNLDIYKLKKVEDFIKEHTLNKESNKKSLIFLKMINQGMAKNDEYITKRQYKIDINKQLKKLHSNEITLFFNLNFLISAIPYIFYMTESDWKMLSLFSLLQDVGLDAVNRTKWVITYTRGLVHNKNIELSI